MIYVGGEKMNPKTHFVVLFTFMYDFFFIRLSHMTSALVAILLKSILCFPCQKISIQLFRISQDNCMFTALWFH